MLNWEYLQPVRIYFGLDERKRMKEIARAFGISKAVLVCDVALVNNGTAEEFTKDCKDLIAASYSGTKPNPTVKNVDECAELIRQSHADGVIALGGGSCMDCAKAASAVAASGNSITQYHGTSNPLPDGELPLLCIPSTSGTGSEVTAVSVLTNEETGVKAPMSSPKLYAKAAILDPYLTYSVPPFVAASTGLDVLSHAVEGFYSINHQPIPDELCFHAASLVFQWLERACSKELSPEAKEKMMEASLFAGLGFNLPKTGPSHACSFVLTNRYHIPHGEACALTQDDFVRYIGASDGGRLDGFAQRLGLRNSAELADRIYDLKKKVGVRCGLKNLNLKEDDIEFLVKSSRHPNINNSPVPVTDDMLREMYRKFSQE